jgi:glycosyltransferase involved in cell wall biosynthesis
MTGCGQCPQLDLPYPGLSRDTTSALFSMKKKAVARSGFNLLVHTKYLAQHYASTFVGQLPIEQIYYGVDTNVYRPLDSAECVAALGVEMSGRFTVALLHSSVTEKRKGLLPLLKPLQALAARMPGKLRVLVVGGASEQAREYETDELPIVTLPFIKDQERLAMALNLSDVLLYPTRADNLSLTCLNALACGVPVISSRIGGQPEAITDGVNGFLCEMDDHEMMIERVAQLADDESLYKQLSLGARQTIIERFDIQLYITKLIDYYERVLQRENHT